MMQQRIGLLFMIVGSLFFAGMGACVYGAHLRDPNLSSLVSSLVRISVNLVIVVLPFLRRARFRQLLGDGRTSLWLRGLFGVCSLLSSFTAIKLIGFGEASFLYASNGFFVAALSPIFLKQQNSKKVWLAVSGAMIGLALLLEPRVVDVQPYGRWIGLMAGFFGALAYMMISKAGTSNSTSTVVFYFCMVGVVTHVVILCFYPVSWPSDMTVWSLLVVAGLLASFAQYFLTGAYQRAPAAEVTAVGYINPVFQATASALIFGIYPDHKGILGAGIVLIFGVALPFAKINKRARRPA